MKLLMFAFIGFFAILMVQGNVVAMEDENALSDELEFEEMKDLTFEDFDESDGIEMDEDNFSLLEQDDDIDVGNKTAKRLCYRKYIRDRRQIRINYQNSKKACSKAAEKRTCLKNARLQYKNARREIYMNYNKCLKASNVSEITDSFDADKFLENAEFECDKTNGTTKRCCHKKFRITLLKTLKNFWKSVKACPEGKEKRLCRKNSVVHLIREVLKAAVSFRKCVKGNKTKDDFADDFDKLEESNEFDIENFESDDEDYEMENEFEEDNTDRRNRTRFCRKKFRPIYRRVCKNYRKSMKQCRSSSERFQCRREVKNRYRNITATIKRDFLRCLKGGITIDLSEALYAFEAEKFDELLESPKYVKCMQQFQAEVNNIVKKLIEGVQKCVQSSKFLQCSIGTLQELVKYGREAFKNLRSCIAQQ